MSDPAQDARSVRVGIIGVGGVGKIHARSVAALPNGRLTVVTDARAETARAAAREFEIRAASSVDELLADAEVDAVIIATPPSSHVEIATRALAAGKHILLEKPLAPTSEAGKELVQTAREHRQQVAMICHNVLFHPALRYARERLNAGGVGDLKTCDAWAYGYTSPGPDDFRHSSDQWSRGAWFDAGIHLIYGLEALSGPVEAAQCLQQRSADGSLGGPDVAAALLRHRTGGLSTARVSYRSKVPGWNDLWPAGWEVGFAVNGDEGAIRIDIAPTGRVTTYRGSGDWEIEREGDGVEASFLGAAAAFVQAILEQRPHVNEATLDDGLRVVRIAEQSLGI